jgi:hypothetical protein
MILQRIIKKFSELTDIQGWFSRGVLRRNASNDSFEWVELTKNDIGLSNVDNTSDYNKPISKDMQLALSNKADKATQLRWIISDVQPDPSQYDLWIKPN